MTNKNIIINNASTGELVQVVNESRLNTVLTLAQVSERFYPFDSEEILSGIEQETCPNIERIDGIILEFSYQ